MLTSIWTFKGIFATWTRFRYPPCHKMREAELLCNNLSWYKKWYLELWLSISRDHKQIAKRVGRTSLIPYHSFTDAFYSAHKYGPKGAWFPVMSWQEEKAQYWFEDGLVLWEILRNYLIQEYPEKSQWGEILLKGCFGQWFRSSTLCRKSGQRYAQILGQWNALYGWSRAWKEQYHKL